MSRGGEPAMPATKYERGMAAHHHGLTIREEFAKAAMQGWLANKARPAHFLPDDDMAYCVTVADALIAALTQEQVK